MGAILDVCIGGGTFDLFSTKSFFIAEHLVGVVHMVYLHSRMSDMSPGTCDMNEWVSGTSTAWKERVPPPSFGLKAATRAAATGCTMDSEEDGD